MPGAGFQFKQILFPTYTQSFCSPVNNLPKGNITDKSKCYCLKFFGVMLRGMSILLIHYPRNKIYSWYVVDQVLSQGSASDLPVANMGPKCLFN